MSEHTEIAVSETPTATCHYRLNEKTGTITVTRGTDNLTFTPTADGKPLLLHATIWDAQAVRDLLALRGQLGDGSCRLMLFKPSEAAVLREHRVKRKQGRFLLSHDGQWLALERPPRILVEKIVSPSEGVVTRCGGYSGEGRLYLGDQAFMIVLGQGATHRHLVRWAGAGVEFFYDHKKPGPEGFHTLGFEEVRRGVTPATAQLALNMGHSALYYDPNRFVLAGRRDSMVFAMDRFGQLAVFGKSGALLCMFMAFRDRLAAWLPDGSRCGSESLSLGPETPGAREQLAAVLKGSGSSLSFPMPSNDSTAEFELTL